MKTFTTILFLTLCILLRGQTTSRPDNIYTQTNKDTINGQIRVSEHFPYVYFTKDNTQLTQANKDSLSWLHDWTAGSTNKIEIQGYCRPDEKKETALLRANSVKNYLIQTGIPADLLVIKDMQQNCTLFYNLTVVCNSKDYDFKKGTEITDTYLKTLTSDRRKAAQMFLQMVMLTYARQ